MSAEKLLLFLGPDKAGSTFFWDTLRPHPGIGVAEAKELFFFDRYFSRGSAWYLDQFEARPTLLDCTHDYLYSSAACERVGAFEVTAFGVVSLRDPLERAVSAFRYMRWQGRVTTPFSSAVFEVDELLDHGAYHRWLPMWQRVLGDRLLLVDFAAMTDGSVETFNRVLGALELDLIEAGDLAANVNVARESRLPPPVMRVGRLFGSALRAAGLHGLQGQLKRKVIESKRLNRSLQSDPIGELDSGQRLRLRRMLDESSEQMEGLVGEPLLVRWAANWDERLGQT